MNIEQARDEINNVFYTVWGVMGPVVWGDLPAQVPSEQTPWARVVLKHNGGGQASLSGETGRRRFNRYGIIAIKIFVPAGGGQTKAYQLAQLVANAYEDAKLDVWFRNIRIKEMGTSGAFEQTDVLADFLYDEVR